MSSDIIAEYVSQDEIEAHEAAMQRVVKDKKREQEAINGKKKKTIEEAEKEADRGLSKSNDDKEKKLAAMQRDFDRLPLLRQVYHEAPNDVFELIVSICCGCGRGGLNAFRLANKRCKQVVESCTTKLFNPRTTDGPDSLPISTIQRCRRIEEIFCLSRNLRSLEGCPDGLRKLYIGNAPHLSDLSPLASCSIMESLVITESSITDISVVFSMPLLEVFSCDQTQGRPSIKDLSPLSSCTRLEEIRLVGSQEIKNLSPLSACTTLKVLDIFNCPLVTSLAPLSNLQCLNKLWCRGIRPQTSLLPLVSCSGLKELHCEQNAVDLEELSRRCPISRSSTKYQLLFLRLIAMLIYNWKTD